MARHLLVAAPFYQGHQQLWTPLLDRLAGDPALAGCDLLRWSYSIGDTRGDRPLIDLSRGLSAAIHEKWKIDGPYESVTLTGHSLGGILSRQAYLLASGVEPATAPRYEWAEHVRRIVLLGSINRGLDWDTGRLQIRALVLASKVLPGQHAKVTRGILRGSSFMTNLRIQWIRHFASGAASLPEVVQVLGTRDTIVRRDDSNDVEQHGRAYLLELDRATHRDLVQLERAADPDARYRLLRATLVGEIPASAVNRSIEGRRRVIFLTHGIRAFTHDWADRAERIVKERAPDVEVVKPTNGWFSALRFALPLTRKNHLRLFRDAYSETLARNPAAEFNYIGHSNGTYLLGQTLREVPGMRFQRAALAASVLPPSYPWREREIGAQVEAVRADCASNDYPVGFLCSALNRLGMRDIGPAGVLSFDAPPTRFTRVAWHPGGHSSMLGETNLATLVEFALEGRHQAPAPTSALLGQPDSRLLRLMRWSGVILVGLLLALFGVLALFVMLPVILGAEHWLASGPDGMLMRTALATSILAIAFLFLDLM